jgi:cytoskeletal protein CcmA (bactofilin family)
VRKLLVFAAVILAVLVIGGVTSRAVVNRASTTTSDAPIFTSSYNLDGIKSDDLFVIADNAHLLAGSHVEADASLIGRSGVTLNGQIDGDLTVMSGSITMGKGALIKGDAVLIGNSVTLDGQISGDLKIVSENLSINPGASFKGDLDICTSHLINEQRENIAVRQCGTNELAGWQSIRTGLFAAKPFTGGFSFGVFIVVGLVTLGLAALSGLIVTIFPRRFGQMTETIRMLPRRASRVGCLTLLMAVMVVGLLVVIIAVLPPVGLVLMPILALLMLPLGILFVVGWMTMALLAGDWLLRRFARRASPPMLTVIAGSLGLYAIWTLLGVLPFGFLVSALVMVGLGAVGLGAAIMTRAGSRSASPSYFVQG